MNVRQKSIKAATTVSFAESKKVLNDTGSTISANALVVISEVSGTAYLTVVLADANGASDYLWQGDIYIAKHDIPDGRYGHVAPWATITGIDTSGYSAVGSLVYLSDTAGAYAASAGTNTKVIGQVVAKDATDGAIYLAPGKYAAFDLLTTDGVRFEDDVELEFGDSGDWSLDYDSASDTLVIVGIPRTFSANDATGVSITSGAGTTACSGKSGQIDIASGDQTAAGGGATGDINITTGDSTNDDSGDINLTCGTPAGGSDQGSLNIDANQVVLAADTQLIGGALYTSTARGTHTLKTTNEVALLTYATIPANTLQVGSVVKVRYSGLVIDNNGTDTVAVNCKLGDLAAEPCTGTNLVAGTATDVADADVFSGEVTMIVRTTGASGTAIAYGTYCDPIAIAAPPVVANLMVQTAEFAIDTTAELDIGVTVTWNAAHADNECALDILSVEIS